MFGMCLGKRVKGLIECLCCMVVIGPIMIVIGIVFLASSPVDTRQHLIEDYNDAVETWTNKGRSQFKGLEGIIAQAETLARPLQIIALSSNTVEDPLNDSDKSDFDTYQALKYKSSGPAPLSLPKMREVLDAPGGFTEYTLRLSTSAGVGEEVGHISLDRFYRHDTYDDSRTCSRNGGYLPRSHGDTVPCEYVYELNSVCIAIAHTGSGSWGVSNSGGCEYNTGIKGDSRHFLAAQYVLVKANGNVRPSSFPAKSVPVMVRSADDPHVIAERLTQGSLKFGLTRTQKAVTGIVLLVLGSIFTLPSIFLIMNFRKNRRDQQMYVQQGAVYQYPAQTTSTFVPLNPNASRTYVPPNNQYPQQQSYAPPMQQPMQPHSPPPYPGGSYGGHPPPTNPYA